MIESTRDAFDGARYAAGQRGHYESWFQRANHPTRPEAFWIRYTLFAPKAADRAAVGELWAIHFRRDASGKTRIVAVREEHPIDGCTFAPRGLDVRVGGARLARSAAGHGALAGAATHGDHRIGWDLAYEGRDPTLFLLPERLYGAPFPKAKALVGTPHAIFRGTLEVDGETVDVDGWRGSQNHNWGSKHTDEYAWGQVAGFDDEPDAFLELSTARVHLGTMKTPWLTPLVLRLGTREIALNGLLRAARNDGHYEQGPGGPLRWEFHARDGLASVQGFVEAPRESFVALPYGNPPGGIKTCLNCKLARCEVRVRDRSGERVLRTESRAAFEILTERTDHGIPLAF